METRAVHSHRLQFSALCDVLRCFDTVGWVIRPVNTIGCIRYIVLVQTLSHAQSINRCRLQTSEARAYLAFLPPLPSLIPLRLQIMSLIEEV